MTTPLDLRVKQLMREFLQGKMEESRTQMHPFSKPPAIIVREHELETFLDAMWVSVNKNLLMDQTHETGD